MRERVVQPAPKRSLRFLYGTRFGGFLLKILTRRWISRLAGTFLDGRLSKGLIKGYIRRHRIRSEDYLPEKYKSFNAFFTRKIKPELRPFDVRSNALCAPCDGKLTAFPVTEEGEFTVKGFAYTAKSLIGDEALARRFYGGVCLVFRLCVEDYHRYRFFDGGSAENSVFIRGRLHTVQPAALEKRRVFTENCREYTLLHTRNFGDAVQVEVGALMVGRIVNLHVRQFERGDEKGRFEFGGSTVIVLLQKGAAQIDEDITQNSAQGFETAVKCGEKIGTGCV